MIASLFRMGSANAEANTTKEETRAVVAVLKERRVSSAVTVPLKVASAVQPESVTLKSQALIHRTSQLPLKDIKKNNQY